MDLPGECQSSATNLGLRRPGGAGGDIGSLKARACCSLPVFCLLNKPVLFILWKNLATRFPVLALERLRSANSPPPPPPSLTLNTEDTCHHRNLGLWTPDLSLAELRSALMSNTSFPLAR